jgi:hypothetical protein
MKLHLLSNTKQRFIELVLGPFYSLTLYPGRTYKRGRSVRKKVLRYKNQYFSKQKRKFPFRWYNYNTLQNRFLPDGLFNEYNPSNMM